MPKVTFTEGGKKVKEVEVPAGTNLRRAAIDNGIPIHHEATLELLLPNWVSQYVNCHGLGSCGTCHVLVKSGQEHCSSKGFKERCRLAVATFAIGHEEEVRLACQTTVQGDMEVEIHPPMNLFGDRFWE